MISLNPMRPAWAGAALMAALLGLAQTATAQTAPAGVRIEPVSITPSETVLRVVVAPPQLDKVETPSGVFHRFSQRGAYGAVGVDRSEIGQPEIPVAGFSLALPVDGKDSSVNIEPEGEIQRLPARLYPIQRPEANRTGDRSEPKFEFNPDVWFKGVKRPGQSLGERAV